MATVENNSDASMAEKARISELEDGNRDEVDGGINHHSWDNHTSFNKYPTHQEGYENKVLLETSALMSNTN